MKGFRRQRAAEQIRRELTQILDTEFPDEDLPSFYIHKVELSPDMGLARALLTSSTVGGKLDEDEVMRPLRRLAPKIRASLVKRIQFRRAPNVVFQVDRGLEHKERIDTLLDRIKKRTPPTDLTAFLLAAALWPLFALAPARAAETPALESFEAEAQVMGTTFRIAAYGPEKRRLANVVYGAFDEAKRINNLISNYRDDSELSLLNREAAARSVEVSQEMADFLADCLVYSRATDGAFDVTVGRLMETWGFFKGSGKLPSDRAVRRALEQVGYQYVAIDGRSVRFTRNGLALDPGGVGKGYAVDRIVAWLQKYEVPAAMVSAGTSTLYALGAPPDEPRGWKVQLRSVDDPDKPADVVFLQDESLSTSGSYEKFFTVDGVRYSHIMDVRTGKPAQGVAAVSVRAPSALDTEVWTTALFVLGEDWARQHAPQDLAVFFCPDQPGASCHWLN